MNQVNPMPQIFVQQGSVPLASGISLVWILAILMLVGWLVVGTAYMRYTGLSRWRSALLWLISFGIATSIFAINVNDMRDDRHILRLLIFALLFSTFSAPFVARLYRKWIGGHLIDSENLPGMDGVRAWLTPGNLVCAILIPICAWQAFGYSLAGMFALTFGLLLAYPIFNMASTAPQPAPAAPVEDLAAEREKVLQLLESGRISADESAELLNALGQSVPPRPSPPKEMELSPARKIVLLGAGLLLIGFFLPWFNINLGHELNNATAQMQQMMGSMIPGNLMPRANLTPNTVTVQVHAGDIAHGLGWWILVLGIVAAVLPLFATTLKARVQKKVILTALAVGAFLLAYLLRDAFRYVSIGVVLALAAYALEFVGTLKETPQPL